MALLLPFRRVSNRPRVQAHGRHGRDFNRRMQVSFQTGRSLCSFCFFKDWFLEQFQVQHAHLHRRVVVIENP